MICYRFLSRAALVGKNEVGKNDKNMLKNLIKLELAEKMILKI